MANYFSPEEDTVNALPARINPNLAAQGRVARQSTPNYDSVLEYLGLGQSPDTIQQALEHLGLSDKPARMNPNLADPLESFRSLSGLKGAYERRVQPIINNATQTFSTGGAIGDLLRLYGETAAPAEAAVARGMGIPYQGPITAKREEGVTSGENFRPMGDRQQQFAGQLLGDPINLQPLIAPAARGAVALGRFAGPELAGGLESYMGRTGMQLNAVPNEIASKLTSYGNKSDTTVMRPQRNAYPGIYGNPQELAAEAASRVAPENPLLQQLFDVSRDDLWQISQQGKRQGNMPEQPFKSGEIAKGSKYIDDLMNPRNVNRLQSIIGEAEKLPALYQPMASWYVTDPLFKLYVKEFGMEEAIKRFNKMNSLMGMASPGSEVLSEINRGTAANWLSTQGRFEDFVKHGGTKVSGRGSDFPIDMAAVIPHPYHPTAHSGPMSKYLAGGVVDMQSAKVPTYIKASGVPETGFQTNWPVGDAHLSRIVGMPDVRGKITMKGQEVAPGAAASVPEMVRFSPFFREKIASPMGLEAVPAQAVLWGAGSGATGVTSQIGAGKLELLAGQIGKMAQRMGISPIQARDMLIRGEGHAGFVTPDMAAAIAAGALGSAAFTKYLLQDNQ